MSGLNCLKKTKKQLMQELQHFFYKKAIHLINRIEKERSQTNQKQNTLAIICVSFVIIWLIIISQSIVAGIFSLIIALFIFVLSVPFMKDSAEIKDYDTLLKAKLMQDFLYSTSNPNIIHYTSPVKPWNNPEVPFAPEFWQSARKTPYYEAILQVMTETLIINTAKETTLYMKCNSSNRIVLWGASLFLENFIKKYNVISNNIIGIIDKNPVKKGKFIGQYEIFAPEDLEKLKPQKIIITIVNSAQIRAQEVREYCKENNINNISIETI